MKAILTLMTIAIVMLSIGMVTADTDKSGLLASMTTQDYVDYYGMKYLEGDRSKCTVETLALFAETYGVYPTMDIHATAIVTEVTVVAEPVQTPVVAPEPTPPQTVEEPEVLPAAPANDVGSNLTLIIIMLMVVVVGAALLIYTRQNDEE